jgi:hypothetical protein
MLQLLQGFFIFFLLSVYVRYDNENGSITHVIAAQNFDVHFQTLFKQAESVLVVTSLHVAFSEKSENLRMVTLGLLMLLE